MMTASDKTTSKFVADYRREKDFYSKAARLASELCQSLLASNTIRTIVTHRTKQVSRLEYKLRERVSKLGRKSETSDDVRNDIVDLAGVRIALYFLNDAEKIAEIVKDAFILVKPVSFPEPKIGRRQKVADRKSSRPFKQRFAGYVADHYRVRMRLEQLLSTAELRAND
jgi:ppGpp synthetase/RelA/SpoT-type nucleotidyltranferase